MSGSDVDNAEPWLSEIARRIEESLLREDPRFTLNLSSQSRVSLFNWSTVVALLERYLSQPTSVEANIDLVGTEQRVLDVDDFLAVERGATPSQTYTEKEIAESRRAYRLGGFLESLDTAAVLTRSSRQAQVSYPWFGQRRARLRAFYRDRSRNSTVLHGFTRIQSKADCANFLDDSAILEWRRQMQGRFPESPLFHTEELWRVVCHELGANIWEHAGVAGFLASRVIETRNPIDARRWALRFPETFRDVVTLADTGFLELCVVDCGTGFLRTLSEAFGTIVKRPPEDTVELLAFAFDKVGTSKSKTARWATTRHALWRILSIVAKYSGAIRLRSDGSEISYVPGVRPLVRNSWGFGYEPHGVDRSVANCGGAQLQILLPLFPHRRLPPKESRSHGVLPSSFVVQEGQVQGHYLPLKEVMPATDLGIGSSDVQVFRDACEALCRQLLDREPRAELETLVVDFSELEWHEAQFEAFLTYCHPLLQGRRTLLVGLEPILAQRVVDLEIENAKSQIADETDAGVELLSTNDLPEPPYIERYLDVYRRVQSLLLGIDRNGTRYLFGSFDHRLDGALKELIHTPATAEFVARQLQSMHPDLSAGMVHTVLQRDSSLFRFDRDLRQWKCRWSDDEIAVEQSRSMTDHFDRVIDRSDAWLARRHGPGSEYYLPWNGEWRSNFLDTAAVLSRGRQADEAAQRLLSRLLFGLEALGSSLDQVTVLAATSSPGMLLAVAIHKWWPGPRRPTVIDLGHYVLLKRPPSAPELVKEGSAVIIQGVIDDGSATQAAKGILESAGLVVRCVLGLIHFDKNAAKTKGVSVFEGWTDGLLERIPALPAHALVRLPRPERVDGPPVGAEGKLSFSIEPRALKARRYTTLSGELEGRDPDLARRDKVLSKLDDTEHGCVLAAGHYVFGRRHYVQAIDIDSVLQSAIGLEIAEWLADVCADRDHPKVAWENRGAKKLRGDVTVVLMPLHSQIHYLWPEVERILARRGRRQWSLALPATLVTGAGPVYIVPDQLKFQIEEAAKRLANKEEYADSRRVRVLVLDDAKVTATTAETILATLLRISNRYQRIHKSRKPPVEWIRYFSIFDESEFSHHTLWSKAVVWNRQIPILFDSFAPFMGAPVYDESNCPACGDLLRMQRLVATATRFNAPTQSEWATARARELSPVAIDSLRERVSERPRLARVIEPTGRSLNETRGDEGRWAPMHADSAIWRFYQLMHASYPPSRVLGALWRVAANQGLTGDDHEVERYRWAVYEWCFRHWPRVVSADRATRPFFNAVFNEVRHNTRLVERVAEGLAQLVGEKVVDSWIRHMVALLRRYEVRRSRDVDSILPDETTKALTVYRALLLFFLSSESESFRRIGSAASTASTSHFHECVEKACVGLPDGDWGLLSALSWRLKRPVGEATPEYAVEVVAATLLRNRRTTGKEGHRLLHGLLSDILSRGATDLDLVMLDSAVAAFVSALEILEGIFRFADGVGVKESIAYGHQVLHWLTTSPPEGDQGGFAVEELADLTTPGDGKLWLTIRRVLNTEVAKLAEELRQEARKKGHGRLKLEIELADIPENASILLPAHQLLVAVANLLVDPIVKLSGEYPSKLVVRARSKSGHPDRHTLELHTKFEDLEVAAALIAEGRRGFSDRVLLTLFGARFSEPTASSLTDFSTCIEIEVPAGFS